MWNSSHVDMFQVVMITIYLVLCTFLLVLLYLNMKEQCLLSHLLPFSKKLSKVLSQSPAHYAVKLRQDIYNHYSGTILITIRRAMLFQHFGPDIGEIIVCYLPKIDDYDFRTDL